MRVTVGRGVHHLFRMKTVSFTGACTQAEICVQLQLITRHAYMLTHVDLPTQIQVCGHICIPAQGCTTFSAPKLQTTAVFFTTLLTRKSYTSLRRILWDHTRFATSRCLRAHPLIGIAAPRTAFPCTPCRHPLPTPSKSTLCFTWGPITLGATVAVILIAPYTMTNRQATSHTPRWFDLVQNLKWFN